MENTLNGSPSPHSYHNSRLPWRDTGLGQDIITMARKKSNGTSKTLAPAASSKVLEDEIQWPTVSVKEDLECRELVPDQIYVIDVRYSTYILELIFDMVCRNSYLPKNVRGSLNLSPTCHWSQLHRPRKGKRRV